MLTKGNRTRPSDFCDDKRIKDQEISLHEISNCKILYDEYFFVLNHDSFYYFNVFQLTFIDC